MGLLSKLTGRDKRRSQRRGAKEKALGKRNVGLSYGRQALDQLQKGAEARISGFEDAQRRTSSGVRTAKRQAMDESSKAAGSIAARFGGAGSQTTAYDNAVAGLSSRTTRRLSDIDLTFSQALSNLDIGKGQAQARGHQDIASGLGALGNVESQYYNDLLGLYNNPQFYSKGHDAFDIIGLGASVAGAFSGMGGAGQAASGAKTP